MQNNYTLCKKANWVEVDVISLTDHLSCQSTLLQINLTECGWCISKTYAHQINLWSHLHVVVGLLSTSSGRNDDISAKMSRKGWKFEAAIKKIWKSSTSEWISTFAECSKFTWIEFERVLMFHHLRESQNPWMTIFLISREFEWKSSKILRNFTGNC